jgi:diamine N-acetyltransferase
VNESKPEISLREVTKQTLRDITGLKVSPEQQRLVGTNAESIAEAYFSPDIAWFRAIYADDTPVGFLMLEDNAAKEQYFLWRFMIDARYQRQGIGQRALELLFEHVKRRPGASVLYTSCVPGEGSPGPFYEKLGFVYTGEEDNGELVMRRDL